MKDFSEFYKLWRKKERMNALKVTCGIVLSTIASSLSYEGQIARDVSRIRRRIDRMGK